MSRPSISVVLPFLNESAILRTLFASIRDALQTIPCDSEIIFVNDGSTDDSGRIVDEIAAKHANVLVLHLSRNFGQQAAVHAGLQHASGQAVILMDSDGQDDPRAIGQLFQLWQEGHEVVSAVRASRTENIVKRSLFRLFYRALAVLSDTPIQKDAGNFCLIDRCVVDLINAMPESDRYFPGMRSWVGFRQTTCNVARLDRHDQTPRVQFSGLVRLAKTALFGFSRAPLIAFYWIAAISACLSVGFIGFAVFHKLFTGLATPGWASIGSLTAFFGALNSLGIAILGEYIARIYDQVRSRPPYIVNRLVGTSRQSTSAALTWDGEISDHREPTLASGLNPWLPKKSNPVASAIGSHFNVPATDSQTTVIQETTGAVPEEEILDSVCDLQLESKRSLNSDVTRPVEVTPCDESNASQRASSRPS